MFQGLKNVLKYDDMSAEDDRKEKFNFDYLIGNLRNIFVFIVSVLVSSCKMTSGATPFGISMIGAINNIGIPLIIPVILISIISRDLFWGSCRFKICYSITNLYGYKSILEDRK